MGQISIESKAEASNVVTSSSVVKRQTPIVAASIGWFSYVATILACLSYAFDEPLLLLYEIERRIGTFIALK